VLCALANAGSVDAGDTSRCSPTEAKAVAASVMTPPALRRLVARFTPHRGGVTNVLCVDITRDRRPDMLYQVSTGGSAGTTAWAAYRFAPSGWRIAGRKLAGGGLKGCRRRHHFVMGCPPRRGSELLPQRGLRAPTVSLERAENRPRSGLARRSVTGSRGPA
jgi:hypothetical protein